MTVEITAAGGLMLRVRPDLATSAQSAVAALVTDDVAVRLAAKDHTLWGAAAEAESAIRLGWVDTFLRSRELLPPLAELRAELADLPHVVLAGMGGSSLAPEVIARTIGRQLTVLDTTDPGQVRSALSDRLTQSVIVIASKSGSTVETDSQRRAYWQALLDAGLSEAEAGRRFVVVTDPGSPLEGTAQDMGAFVMLADPDVGGRYSALTAFGLVPAALAGVDVAELLDQAEEFARSLSAAADANPALLLGAVLGSAALAGQDKVALVDDGSGITGLGDWAEQLIAESTGKEGRGILPVVVESPTAAGVTGVDVLTVTTGGALLPGAVPGSGVLPDVAVNGPLGAQFLCWEAATAIAGRLLRINPFDQPNVTESKQNTAKILTEGLPEPEPSFVEGEIIGYAGPGLSNLDDALRHLVAGLGTDGYLAVMAYLDRFADADIAQLRELLATASGRPVTFGWGPRFLHSTGQYHKGGPQLGSFLQITGDSPDDLPVPGRSYGFARLQAAQAAGDRQALAGRRRPLLHLHLADRPKGIVTLLEHTAALAAGR